MTENPDTAERLAALFAELPPDSGPLVDEAVAVAEDAADLRERLAALTEAPTPELGDDEVAAVPVTTEATDDGAVDRVRSTVGGLRSRVADGIETMGSKTRNVTDIDSHSDSHSDDSTDEVPDVPATTESPEANTPRPTPVTASSRSLARVRGHARSGITELKHTARNADPKQAALWGVATGVTLANPAIAAGYSTAVLLSGAVLGGSVVGAYASSHENTVFDGVDPLEMARRSRGMSAANAHRTNVNGAALGSLLGVSTYLAETMTPEEYAHWLTGVDADLVARGAELGAGRAVTDEELGVSTPRTGALLGGGFGLLYGLATEGAEEGDDTLRELLDDDLFEEYEHALDDSESPSETDVETDPEE
ncbi:hypothetical protein AUR64_16750 [Haloprofundus marisrubri]|uniref:Uncharacterized protein n=1 Tax=Haloprofundus marisrubri TaxID=1514971 RepID=A0A0W1R8C6_9EURY|nr:hypothetical protein [Haloprofundus marisrubri]KTG09426.1 hypothetical protein AUR64_16750 [Haloprofundus marisrubri]